MPTTPLRDRHVELGARFTDFGGWDMPLQYEGVLAEHAAVRSHAGVFDVTHLGRFVVIGDGATALLRTLLCNDIARVDPGRAQYTMALNDGGGVEDDIIVWRLAEEHYWVLPNGANFHEIVGRFHERAEPGITIDPVRDETVLLAVQGPEARRVVEAVLGASPGRFRVQEATFGDGPLWMAGTGYTGEKGCEIAVPSSAALPLFDALVEAGAAPAGLGARDTLRLEMGYPLWGQDLDETTTPLEADLEWVVDWNHDFVGKAALIEQKAAGIERRLVGFRTSSRRAIPRPGYALRTSTGGGTVASGNFSPTLECGIGMGYVSPPPGDEPALEVDIRGEWVVADVVVPPFIDR
jgi:aminomethyltransferase